MPLEHPLLNTPDPDVAEGVLLGACQLVGRYAW